MRRLACLITLLALSIVMGGCATTTPLPEAARASIDHVSIADAVPIKPTYVNDYGIVKSIHYNPHFIGGTFLTQGSGPLGDAILASGESDENRQYAMFVKAAGIDVSRIVHDEFASQLRKSPLFGPRLAQTAKYRFELDIPHYGLIETRTLSDYYKASVTVHARLIGPDGEVVAEASGHSCIFTECFPTDKLSDILAKPELLRAQYVAAAHVAIQELLKSL